MEKNKKPRKTTKGLSKLQIGDICIGLRKQYTFGQGDIIKHVCKILENDITLQDEDCQHAIGVFLDASIIDKLGDKFIELYKQCHTGILKDRYALFQISWSEWACACLLSGTPENLEMIPDEASVRDYDAQESNAIRAVFSATCAAFFEASSSVIKDIRPQGRNEPSVPKPQYSQDFDTVLGFTGSCMRLVYRKCDSNTKDLIRSLQMTEAMKIFYSECGVLSPGTISHKTLPVRALNKYLTYLNKCLTESCNTDALQLYGKEFIKV